MVRLNDLEVGEIYKFIINQKGERYTAEIRINTSFDSHTESITGRVMDSNYDNNNWVDKSFRINKDKTVKSVFGSPFGSIGTVEKINELNY